MAIYPEAEFRGPIPNMDKGGNSPRLFVLHIMEGTLDGTDSWFHNPAAEASSNFGNGKGGLLYQWVDTSDTAWAQAAYNHVAVSIEHEGETGDFLTPQQLENDAQLLAWAHRAHGIPLQVTDDPNGSGVIGHGLLGVAGGNHPDCPGTPVLDARQAVVDRAVEILSPQNGPDMAQVRTLYDSANGQQHYFYFGGSTLYHRVYDETTGTMSSPVALPSFGTGTLDPSAGVDATIMMKGTQLHVIAKFADISKGSAANYYTSVPRKQGAPEQWGSGVL